jgi:hypothetical protein
MLLAHIGETLLKFETGFKGQYRGKAGFDVTTTLALIGCRDWVGRSSGPNRLLAPVETDPLRRESLGRTAAKTPVPSKAS